MSEKVISAPAKSTILASSLLVFGNVLGVGVLALPITAGLGGGYTGSCRNYSDMVRYADYRMDNCI